MSLVKQIYLIEIYFYFKKIAPCKSLLHIWPLVKQNLHTALGDHP